jgi:hypothetical protein
MNKPNIWIFNKKKKWRQNVTSFGLDGNMRVAWYKAFVTVNIPQMAMNVPQLLICGLQINVNE